jgi:YHS domain-containing protein
MTRNLLIFIGTFVAGALVALLVRAATFDPHAGHEGHPAGGGDYAAMVSNPLAPPPAATPAPAAKGPGEPVPMARPAVAGQPVNTVCSICGMDVDPRLPTAEYKGQTIGFGCRMCPPKFKADPDRYGPAYLKNEVIER